jgi:hypothetical protein
MNCKKNKPLENSMPIFSENIKWKILHFEIWCVGKSAGKIGLNDQKYTIILM